MLDVRKLQEALNHFSATYLKGVAPLIVDGLAGPATSKRVVETKFYLGYSAPINDVVDDAFNSRMWHPGDVKYDADRPGRIADGAKRRALQRARFITNRLVASVVSGVGKYDGVPVAKWMIPYLEWARANGWAGRLTSGWRDPHFSQSLCESICGAPTCPGRCAGLTSNHVGSAPPKGAVDVTDYGTFGSLMARCPIQPHLQNLISATDPVHFSVSGH